MIPFWRLSGYYFFYFAFIGAFAPYFTLYLQSLHFSAADIAVLMSLMQVMRILAPNLWGLLADRAGRRVGIVRLSGAASLVGFCGFFATESFAGVFVAMALMSFFWSAALPLVEGLTFDHLGSSMGRYGKIRSWGSVGFIVAVLAIGYALEVLPERHLLWMTALILAGIIACALSIPEPVRAARPPSDVSLAEILRRREVQALLLACFLMSAAHGALYVFYSIHLVDAGYGTDVVGWMWTLGVVAEIGVFMAMPQMLRAFSLRAILGFAFVCAVLRFAMIGWGVDSLATLLLAQLMHGATFGAYHAAAIAAIHHWFPGRAQSRGQALYGSLSFGAGGMLGGLVSGYLWEPIGAAWTYTVGSGFALAGLLVIVVGMGRTASLAELDGTRQ
ncbi:MAG: MFS transporter [Rhodocyclaceae bacterium]|nr:MFS transporter [Rhodocyclaceae bacterium]